MNIHKRNKTHVVHKYKVGDLFLIVKQAMNKLGNWSFPYLQKSPKISFKSTQMAMCRFAEEMSTKTFLSPALVPIIRNKNNLKMKVSWGENTPSKIFKHF